MRVCRCCEQLKDESEFRRRADGGLHRYCRLCESYLQRVRKAKSKGKPAPTRTDIPQMPAPRVWPLDELNVIANGWRGPVDQIGGPRL